MSEADAELEELLATAMAPSPALKVVTLMSDRSNHPRVPNRLLVAKFLREHEIKPGRSMGIEVSELYQLFLGWAIKLEGESQIVTPIFFSKRLRDLGFYRARTTRYGRDCRPLLCSSKSAWWLRAWIKEHPVTKAQRLLFCFRLMKERDHQ